MTFHPDMAYGATFHKSTRKLEDEGPPFAYTVANRARFEEIVTRYPPDRRRSAVVPALYLAQYQQGYNTANAIRYVAGLLRALGFYPVVAGSAAQGVFGLVDGIGDELTRVLVLEAVVDLRALMAGGDDAREAELGEMLRDGGRRLVDDVGKQVHRELTMIAERQDDPDPGRVGEHREHLDGKLDILAIRRPSENLLICIHTQIMPRAKRRLRSGHPTAKHLRLLERAHTSQAVDADEVGVRRRAVVAFTNLYQSDGSPLRRCLPRRWSGTGWGSSLPTHRR